MRETRVQLDIAAAPPDVYRLLLDPTAIAVWKVPEGMRCEVHRFEAREGGRFRVSLTYEAADAVGKSGARTDTYHGAFVRLLPEREVVERMVFETGDPDLQGWMTVTYHLRATPGGTHLVAIHSGVPPGVALEDNETGWAMALDRLATLATTR